MTNKQTFANTLRTARQAAGLTQAAVAVEAGIAVSTLSRLEGYPFPVAPLTADKLARALGIKSTALFPYLKASRPIC